MPDQSHPPEQSDKPDQPAPHQPEKPEKADQPTPAQPEKPAPEKADKPAPAPPPPSPAGALADQLKALVDGLLLLSESEAGLTVVTLPADAVLPDALRELAHLPPDAPAEEWAVADFLAPYTSADEGADAATLADAQRFAALLAFLTDQLKRAVAWKLGAEAKKAVFLIGRQPDRVWLGVQTEVVET